MTVPKIIDFRNSLSSSTSEYSKTIKLRQDIRKNSMCEEYEGTYMGGDWFNRINNYISME